MMRSRAASIWIGAYDSAAFAWRWVCAALGGEFSNACSCHKRVLHTCGVCGTARLRGRGSYVARLIGFLLLRLHEGGLLVDHLLSPLYQQIPSSMSMCLSLAGSELTWCLPMMIMTLGPTRSEMIGP